MKCNKPFKLRVNGIDKVQACGKCINCRKLRASDWSLRLNDHLSIYPNSTFITLTYKPNSQDATPRLYSLSHYEISLFVKRLRKTFKDRKISLFGCGEYGELTRPHYHIILFNVPIKDLEIYKIGKKMVSTKLEEIWKHGFNTVGFVEDDSIHYVTGYVLKKAWGHHGKEEYEDTGRETPFQFQSKNIGMEYFLRNYMKIKQDFWDGKPLCRYYIKLMNELGANRGSLLNETREERDLVIKKIAPNMKEAKRLVLQRNDQLEVDYKSRLKLSRRKDL